MRTNNVSITSCTFQLPGTGFIEDLIAEAIDVVTAPIEDLLDDFISGLIDEIGLPEIGFSIEVSSPKLQTAERWVKWPDPFVWLMCAILPY